MKFGEREVLVHDRLDTRRVSLKYAVWKNYGVISGWHWLVTADAEAIALVGGDGS